MAILTRHSAAVVLVACAFLLAPAISYASVDLGNADLNTVSNGLVGYWPFDGDTTNWNTDSTVDVSGNGNAGTLVNMSTTSSPVAGKIGGALGFRGTTQYVSVQNSPSI